MRGVKIHIRRLAWALVFLGLLLGNTIVLAEEAPEPGGEEVPEEILSPGESEGDSYEEQAEVWSKRITSTASWMDSFFDTEQYVDTSNKTYLRLRVSPVLDKNGLSFNSYVDLRLMLPRSEKWLLNFGGDPDAEDQYGSSGMDVQERDNSGRDQRNAYAGISRFLKRTRTRNVGFGGGVRFRNIGIVPYAHFKWTELWEFDNWDLRGMQRFRYYTDDGLEFKSQLDFEWPIAHKFFARGSGSALFKMNDPTNYYDVDYSLFQYLSTRRAIQYRIATGYQASPGRSTYLSSVNYEVEYRQQWRKWFYTSLIPQVSQHDSDDWKAHPGLRLDFNVILGHVGEFVFKSAYTTKQENLEIKAREDRERALQEAHERFMKLQEEQEAGKRQEDEAP